MSTKTIAVTGHAGYIGRILVQRLLEQGYNVIAIDREYISKDKFSTVSTLTQYQGDFASDVQWLGMLNYLDCRKELAGIVHLAAESLLGPSVTDPMFYFMNNVSKSIQFLDYLMVVNVRVPFIFASSAAVYGDLGHNFPIHIHEAGQPINPYGRTKLQFEEVLAEVGKAYDFVSTSFRFFNVVGGYGKMGQPNDQPHILTSIIRAEREKKPFVLKGTNYNTYDGTPVRDYIHVFDVCEAIITRIRGNPEHYPTASRYNLCTGAGLSNLQLVEAYKATFNSDLVVEFGDVRPGDPATLIGDPYDFFPWAATEWSSLNNILISARHAYLRQRND